ncbi:hypothetical protein Pfo_011960 [Paulownia fortunei]|nr:hypothetical protein Pfo_011960 [Paulownia fortunei]
MVITLVGNGEQESLMPYHGFHLPIYTHGAVLQVKGRVGEECHFRSLVCITKIAKIVCFGVNRDGQGLQEPLILISLIHVSMPVFHGSLVLKFSETYFYS